MFAINVEFNNIALLKLILKKSKKIITTAINMFNGGWQAMFAAS